MTNLKNKSISSAKWNLLANTGQYFFTFFLSIVLSRMITPAEFGLTSMLTIFISISTLLVGSGLSLALIRDKNASKEDFTTVFYFNVGISLILYFTLFFCAPLIADFYNQAELIGLTRWISLVFVINSVGMIQNTILLINLDFRKQTIINISGLFISVIISIIMALKGFGVYSIVAQTLSQALFVNLFLWASSTWRPEGFFNITSFKKLWKYSSNILVTGIFNTVMINVDNLIIGKIFRPHILGLYTRAKSTKAIPELIFVNVLNTTSFSILSKIHDDITQFRQKHMLFFKISVYFIFPFVVVFSLCSAHLIQLLYGDKWMSAVDYLVIISYASIPNFLAALFAQTILGYGNSKMYMKMNIIKSFLTIFTIPFGLFFGLKPYLYSFVIISFLGLIVDIFFTSQIIGTKKMDYLEMMVKPIIFSVIMFVMIVLCQYFIDFGNIINLFIEVILGLGIYIVLLNFAAKEIFNYFIEFFQSFLKKRIS
jgi:O-antigen/teichoic acid export membrane protein